MSEIDVSRYRCRPSPTTGPTRTGTTTASCSGPTGSGSRPGGGLPLRPATGPQDYEREKRRLQIQLLRLQAWVKDTGQQLVVLFEGRDAAGKGGTIKRFTEHLNPRGTRVVALDKPSEREQTQWYFQRYVSHLPAAGRDRAVRPVLVQPRRRRAGHGLLHRRAVRAVRAPGTGVRADARGQRHPAGEVLVLRLPAEQRTRFIVRRIDPVRQWKLSPTDLASLDRWDDYTAAKEAMFAATDTDFAPWTVVKSNDKKRARLEALRHVLYTMPYDGKDEAVVGRPDPNIVVAAADVLEADREVLEREELAAAR
jgi:hypothetical protein